MINIAPYNGADCLKNTRNLIVCFIVILKLSLTLPSGNITCSILHGVAIVNMLQPQGSRTLLQFMLTPSFTHLRIQNLTVKNTLMFKYITSSPSKLKKIVNKLTLNCAAIFSFGMY